MDQETSELDRRLEDALLQKAAKYGVTSGKKRKSKPKGKMMSLKEYREQMRIAEMAHQGPGAHDAHKPFAAELNHMTIGGKYKHKYDATGGPGHYKPESASKHTKPRSRAAYIADDDGRQTRAVVEDAPAPGQYDGHITEFGWSPQKMTLGGKYAFKASDGPGPG